MNIEQARFNMVEQQIRPWEVLDSRVLDLLFEVRREDFVPAAWRGLAFADLELPLAKGQTMLTPKLEARLVQELQLQASDRVLLIGVGSGYCTALVSKLAKEVTAVEIDPEIAASARKTLQDLGYAATVVEGDAGNDWATGAPWDAILVTGSLPQEPTLLFERLAPEGRLLAIVGDAPVMHAMRFTREEAGIRSENLFETVTPPLKNVHQPERFTF